MSSLNAVWRFFRHEIRPVLFGAIFADGVFSRVKFVQFLFQVVRKGDFDLGDLLRQAGGDPKEAQRRIRDKRDEFVEAHLLELLRRYGLPAGFEGGPDEWMRQLKVLPDYLVEYLAAGDKLAAALQDIDQFKQLPPDIRSQLLGGREEIGNRLIHAAILAVLRERGIDEPTLKRWFTRAGREAKRAFF
ncbi:MAG TPA: hypothetical protein VEI97_12655, partial [bacterium]|nr:hypothetical protein [bacterium]